MLTCTPYTVYIIYTMYVLLTSNCIEFFGSKPVVVEEEKGGEGESRAGSVSRVRRSSSQRSSGDTTSQNPT